MDKKKNLWESHENKEIIRRKPSPISACEDSILRVVVFDSTQTQGSSKYFLFTEKEKIRLLKWKKNSKRAMK